MERVVLGVVSHAREDRRRFRWVQLRLAVGTASFRSAPLAAHVAPPFPIGPTLTLVWNPGLVGSTSNDNGIVLKSKPAIQRMG